MPKHLLFDFDGTLIDSAGGILASFAAVLARYGRQPAVALERSLIGPPLRETLRTVSGCTDDAELDRLVAAFKDDYDASGYLKTQAYPGVAAALAQLHASGAALFIVTNKRLVPTTRILAHFGWERLFQGVFALDGTVPPAANKAALLAQVIAQRKIDAARATMVGDTPEDHAAAARNGLRFAAAQWGYGRFDEATLAMVQALQTPAEIARL